MAVMELTINTIWFVAGGITLVLALIFFLHIYTIRLLAHSIKFCNWICGMAISSGSPWVKILALNLVFLLRLLMYVAIISLEHMDKLTTRTLLKYYISGAREVLLEYVEVFSAPSKKIGKTSNEFNLIHDLIHDFQANENSLSEK